MSDRPAGWHQDPDDPLLERWWDGTDWTGETRDLLGMGEEIDDLEHLRGRSPATRLIAAVVIVGMLLSTLAVLIGMLGS